MKPGRLRRKTPLRRTPFSRSPATSMSQARALAWKWFSRFVRLRGSFDETFPPLIAGGEPRTVKCNRCVTCGAILPIRGKNCIQAGHFIPGRRNGILYDERGCWPQCQLCNVVKKGAWPEYEAFMLHRWGPVIGPEIILDLKQAAKKTVSMTASDHLEIARKYEVKCAEMWGWPEDEAKP